eukprot:4109440-Pyramimonas_sp.AAC.1
MRKASVTIFASSHPKNCRWVSEALLIASAVAPSCFAVAASGPAAHAWAFQAVAALRWAARHRRLCWIESA